MRNNAILHTIRKAPLSLLLLAGFAFTFGFGCGEAAKQSSDQVDPVTPVKKGPMHIKKVFSAEEAPYKIGPHVRLDNPAKKASERADLVLRENVFKLPEELADEVKIGDETVTFPRKKEYDYLTEREEGDVVIAIDNTNFNWQRIEKITVTDEQIQWKTEAPSITEVIRQGDFHLRARLNSYTLDNIQKPIELAAPYLRPQKFGRKQTMQTRRQKVQGFGDLESTKICARCVHKDGNRCYVPYTPQNHKQALEFFCNYLEWRYYEENVESALSIDTSSVSSDSGENDSQQNSGVWFDMKLENGGLSVEAGLSISMSADCVDIAVTTLGTCGDSSDNVGFGDVTISIDFNLPLPFTDDPLVIEADYQSNDSDKEAMASKVTLIATELEPDYEKFRCKITDVLSIADSEPKPVKPLPSGIVAISSTLIPFYGALIGAAALLTGTNGVQLDKVFYKPDGNSLLGGFITKKEDGSGLEFQKCIDVSMDKTFDNPLYGCVCCCGGCTCGPGKEEYNVSFDFGEVCTPSFTILSTNWNDSDHRTRNDGYEAGSLPSYCSGASGYTGFKCDIMDYYLDQDLSGYEYETLEGSSKRAGYAAEFKAFCDRKPGAQVCQWFGGSASKSTYQNNLWRIGAGQDIARKEVQGTFGFLKMNLKMVPLFAAALNPVTGVSIAQMLFMGYEALFGCSPPHLLKTLVDVLQGNSAAEALSDAVSIGPNYGTGPEYPTAWGVKKMCPPTWESMAEDENICGWFGDFKTEVFKEGGGTDISFADTLFDGLPDWLTNFLGIDPTTADDVADALPAGFPLEIFTFYSTGDKLMKNLGGALGGTNILNPGSILGNAGNETIPEPPPFITCYRDASDGPCDQFEGPYGGSSKYDNVQGATSAAGYVHETTGSSVRYGAKPTELHCQNYDFQPPRRYEMDLSHSISTGSVGPGAVALKQVAKNGDLVSSPQKLGMCVPDPTIDGLDGQDTPDKLDKEREIEDKGYHCNYDMQKDFIAPWGGDRKSPKDITKGDQNPDNDLEGYNKFAGQDKSAQRDVGEICGDGSDDTEYCRAWWERANAAQSRFERYHDFESKPGSGKYSCLYKHAECWRQPEDDAENDNAVRDDFLSTAFKYTGTPKNGPDTDAAPGVSYDGSSGPDPDSCGVVASGGETCKQSCVFGVGIGVHDGNGPSKIMSNYEDYNRPFDCKIDCACPQDCESAIGDDRQDTRGPQSDPGLYDNATDYKVFWDKCDDNIGPTKRESEWGYKSHWHPNRKHVVQTCIEQGGHVEQACRNKLGDSVEQDRIDKCVERQCRFRIAESRQQTEIKGCIEDGNERPNCRDCVEKGENCPTYTSEYLKHWPEVDSKGRVKKRDVAVAQCETQISCSENIGQKGDANKDREPGYNTDDDFDQYWTFSAEDETEAEAACKDDPDGPSDSACETNIKGNKNDTHPEYQQYWNLERPDEAAAEQACREDRRRVVKLCQDASSSCVSNCTTCAEARCTKRSSCDPQRNEDPNCQEDCAMVTNDQGNKEKRNPNCYTADEIDSIDDCAETVPVACGEQGKDYDSDPETSLDNVVTATEMQNGPQPNVCVYDTQCYNYCEGIERQVTECQNDRYCVNSYHECYGPGVCAPRDPDGSSDSGPQGNGPCPSPGINLLEKLLSLGVGYLVGMPPQKLLAKITGGTMIPIPSKPDMSGPIDLDVGALSGRTDESDCPATDRSPGGGGSGGGIEKLISGALRDIAGPGKNTGSWGPDVGGGAGIGDYKGKIKNKSLDLKKQAMTRFGKELSGKASKLGISNIKDKLLGGGSGGNGGGLNLGGKIQQAVGDSSTLKNITGPITDKLSNFAGDIGGLQQLGGGLLSGSSNPIKSVITGAGFDFRVVLDVELDFLSIETLNIGIQGDFFFGLILELNFRKTKDWKEKKRVGPIMLIPINILGYPMPIQMELHARAKLHAFVEASIAVGAAFFTVPESLDHPDKSGDDDDYPGLLKAGALPSVNFLDNWYGKDGYNDDWFAPENRFSGAGKYGGDNKKTEEDFTKDDVGQDNANKNDWGIDLVWRLNQENISSMNTHFQKLFRSKVDMEADFQAEIGAQIGWYDGGTGSRLIFFEPANLFLHAYAAILKPYCGAGLGLFYRMFMGFGPLSLRGKVLAEGLRIPLMSMPIVQADWMFPPSKWQINHVCAKEPLAKRSNTSNQIEVAKAPFCGEQPSGDVPTEECNFGGGKTESHIESVWNNGLPNGGNPSKSTIKWVCTLAQMLGCVSKPPTAGSGSSQPSEVIPSSQDDCDAQEKKRPRGFVRLVSATPSSSGFMWRKNKVDVANGFETSFSYRMTEKGDQGGGKTGADGLAFVIHDSSQGAQAVGGTSGSSLGYADIPKSLAVELDTYLNDNEQDSHVAIMSNGPAENTADHSDANVEKSAVYSALDDGEVHSVKIQYTGTRLKVFVDGDEQLSKTVDLQSVLGGSTSAYVGFTAATGWAFQNHDILQWSFFDAQDSRVFNYGDFKDTAGLELIGDAAGAELREFNQFCVPQPRDGLRISLGWNGRADLDLVHQPVDKGTKIGGDMITANNICTPVNLPRPETTASGTAPKAEVGCDLDGDGTLNLRRDGGADVLLGETIVSTSTDDPQAVQRNQGNTCNSPQALASTASPMEDANGLVIKPDAYYSSAGVEAGPGDGGAGLDSACAANTCAGDRGTGGWDVGTEGRMSGRCAPPRNSYSFVESIAVPNPDKRVHNFWVVNSKPPPEKDESGSGAQETDTVKYEIEVEGPGGHTRTFDGEIDRDKTVANKPDVRYKYQLRSGISGTIGDIKLIGPPDDVNPNALEADNTTFIFPERLNHHTSKMPVDIDVTKPAFETAQQDSDPTSDDPDPLMPTMNKLQSSDDKQWLSNLGGEITGKVNVYFVHFDVKNPNQPGASVSEGTVIFDNKILGIVHDSNTFATNHSSAVGCDSGSCGGGGAVCHSPATDTCYSRSTSDASDCECNPTRTDRDWIELIDPKTLKFHLYTGGSSDNIRVITAAGSGN